MLVVGVDSTCAFVVGYGDGKLRLAAHEGILYLVEVSHVGLHSARAVEAHLVEEPVALCCEQGAHVGGAGYLDELQGEQGAVLSLPYGFHSLQLAVAIETYGEGLDDVESEHAAARASHNDEASHGATAVVVVHVSDAHHGVGGHASLYHGVHLGVVVEVFVGKGSKVLHPTAHTHHADELVHGAGVAREGASVAQAAELHVVVSVVVIEVYRVGLILGQVLPIVGPDGLLAILESVAHFGTLKIRTGVVGSWLRFL